MKTNPSDTAYPSAAISNYEETNAVGSLTKREYFAAMAMQGLLANSGNVDETVQADAVLAVKAAESLINELNKKSSNEN